MDPLDNWLKNQKTILPNVPYSRKAKSYKIEIYEDPLLIRVTALYDQNAE